VVFIYLYSLINSILKKNGIDVKFFENNFKKQPYVKIVNNDKKESNKDKQTEKPEQKKKGYYINGKRYSIDLEKVYNLKEPLIILKNMIGMDKVKKTVLDLILYYIQRFEKQNSDMLHTIIEGPPGVGKTELGKILGKVYKALGILKSDKFTIATRSDLIGQYLGQTAPKTQEVIDNASGGVLFIDEAYSLGNPDKRDSFAKECIDTINLNLDKNKKKIIVIIAGYKEELESSFFSYNPGLKRRFPFVFTIDGYKPEELKALTTLLNEPCLETLTPLPDKE
jgi:SpoVK/Ycf46/Vps4 family AAA+-type ATPase